VTAAERVGRCALVAVVAWVVVVVSGSWLVWTVISATGGDFASPRGALPTAPMTDAPHTAAPSARPRAVTVTQSWSGPAGVVTVRCSGARIGLEGAAASADGYAVEVDDRGPDRVVVEFQGRADETVEETHVVARCRGGRPVFATSADG